MPRLSAGRQRYDEATSDNLFFGSDGFLQFITLRRKMLRMFVSVLPARSGMVPKMVRFIVLSFGKTVVRKKG